jgi:hypothetical protein
MTTFTTQDREEAQRKEPLTRDQIIELMTIDMYANTREEAIEFARAIERAHGIGE